MRFQEKNERKKNIVKLEGKNQHTVIINANTSNGIKITIFW